MDGDEGGAAGERTPALTAPWRVAIDVGGTFTDVVVTDADGNSHAFKALSRPADPKGGVLAALDLSAERLGLSGDALLSGCGMFVHGSTVATNTLLERSGARVGLLTTDGFRDSLEIRRGIRHDPWNHRVPYPPVLVPRFLRRPVAERIDRHGRVHAPVDLDSVYAALELFNSERVEAVAICLLNSYLNPAHEQEVAAVVRKAAPDLWVSVSSDLIPVAGEYERLSTTVVDAYVAPRLVSYLSDLDRELARRGLANPMLLVKNNGGTARVEEVVREPVVLTLSGPAAVVGALDSFRDPVGGDDMISLEVGGTSCDVVVMTGGGVTVTDRLSIGEYDTIVPSVEIHTVGAAGGTIASVDSAGVLNVGPRGAGANPGPACYGRGGEEPTVTDAQLVLGRLGTGPYAGGALTLDRERAVSVIRDRVAEPLGLSVEAAAMGIVQVTEQHILHAVSFISVERGLDPRNYTLVAGGGAGGLHGARVAGLLGSPAVYVPRRAGVLCAYGMLNSDVRHDYIRSFGHALTETEPDTLADAFAALGKTARDTLAREGFQPGNTYYGRALDLCYQGQQWDVRVPLPDGGIDPSAVRAAFEETYERLYGHRQPESRIDIVKLRLTGFGRLALPEIRGFPSQVGVPAPAAERRVFLQTPEDGVSVPVYAGAALGAGASLAGPLIVEEETTTILVGEEDVVDVDAVGNYLIRIGGSGDGT